MSDFRCLTEPELIAEIQNSNEGAFQYLFFQYYDDLIRFAAIKTNSKELAQDIVQEAFTRIWYRREKIKIKVSIKPYLYKIVMNLIITDYRKNIKKNIYSMEIQNQEHSIFEQQSDYKLDFLIAMEKLSERTQTFFQLKYFQGFQNIITIPKYKPVVIFSTLFIGLVAIIIFYSQWTSNLTFLTKEGEIKRDVLSDSTVVTLNSQSKISYPKNFQTNRKVHLEGEAYFNVTKSQVPFVVESNEAKVQVLGTKFTVWTRENKTRVVVEDGSVRLSSKQKNVYTELTKGQMCYVMSDSLPNTPQNVELEAYWGWMVQPLLFSEETLEKILLEIENHYHILIKYDSSLGQRKLSATFRDQPLEAVLNSICLALNLKYEIRNGTYFLSSKN